MSDYPMLISNKLHSFRNFEVQIYDFCLYSPACMIILFLARKVIIRIFIHEKIANFAHCRSGIR